MTKQLTAADLASILMDARNVSERHRGDGEVIAAAIEEAKSILNASPWPLLIDVSDHASL